MYHETTDAHTGDSTEVSRLYVLSVQSSSRVYDYHVRLVALSVRQETAKGHSRYGRTGGPKHAMSQTPRVTKRLYSIEEAAQYLGRSEWGIRRLIWEGQLPHIRHGRRVHLDVGDMDMFIERNKVVEQAH
jgi:excisionase family DNA binding protein